MIEIKMGTPKNEVGIVKRKVIDGKDYGEYILVSVITGNEKEGYPYTREKWENCQQFKRRHKIYPTKSIIEN